MLGYLVYAALVLMLLSVCWAMITFFVRDWRSRTRNTRNDLMGNGLHRIEIEHDNRDGSTEVLFFDESGGTLSDAKKQRKSSEKD